MKFVRLGVITVVLATLAGLSAVNLGDRRDNAAGADAEARLSLLNEMVTADPPGTLDSTWYCAATRVRESDAGTHEVFVSNGSDEPVEVELRGVPLSTKVEAEPPQQLELAAHTVLVVDVVSVAAVDVDEIAVDDDVPHADRAAATIRGTNSRRQRMKLWSTARGCGLRTRAAARTPGLGQKPSLAAM